MADSRAAASGVSFVRQQVAPRRVAPPPDPAPQLVELGDPEPVGVLDDHHRGLGDVHADLDHRRGHQHVEPAAPELGHDPLLLGRRELAVEEPDAEPGQLGAGQALGLGHHRGGLDPVRSLDQRAHHEGPVARCHLGPDPLPGLVRLGRVAGQPGGGHREPARAGARR